MHSIGVPALNGTALNQPGLNPGFPTSVLPTTAIPSVVTEPIGQPSECLLLKNMFDPATEVGSCFSFFFTYGLVGTKNRVSVICKSVVGSFLQVLLTFKHYFVADGNEF